MPEYFEMPDVPGKIYFRCERQRATLSTEACSKSWRMANHEKNDERMTCRCCAIGAEHAGEAQASMSPLKDAPICSRCHRTGLRLIGATLCVSCYNRERELVLGRNAKGTPPVKIGVLEPRQVRYLHGDDQKVLAVPRSADTVELVVAILRDAKKRVRFAFTCVMPALTQMRLF